MLENGSPGKEVLWCSDPLDIVVENGEHRKRESNLVPCRAGWLQLWREKENGKQGRKKLRDK